VGDYVNWGWTTRSIGPVWMRHGGPSDLLQLYTGSALFNGDVIGPARPPRTIRFSLEPPVLKLRRGDKVPLRALRHVSDGIATWTAPLDDPGVESDDNTVAYFKGGVVFAKQEGTVRLRLRHDGLYCAASVEVAAHPSGSTVDVLTGLPPVAGIACVGDEVVISTRESALRSVKDGKFALLAAVPVHPPTFGGTDTIAAAASGDLAVRLTDRRGILVLQAGYEYRRSQWVELPDGRVTTSMTWSDAALWRTGSVTRARSRPALMEAFMLRSSVEARFAGSSHSGDLEADVCDHAVERADRRRPRTFFDARRLTTCTPTWVETFGARWCTADCPQPDRLTVGCPRRPVAGRRGTAPSSVDSRGGWVQAASAGWLSVSNSMGVSLPRRRWRRRRW